MYVKDLVLNRKKNSFIFQSKFRFEIRLFLLTKISLKIFSESQ